MPNEVSPSNLFFRNRGDGTFEEATDAFGLTDYLITAAASEIDLDNDGDLDFLIAPVNGPVMNFINNSATGNAMVFAFGDRIGNRFGIGNRIVAKVGERM